MAAMFEDPSMYERAPVATRSRQQSSSGELSHNGFQMDGQQLQQQSSSEYHHHQLYLQQQQLQQQQGHSSGSDTDFGEGGGALGTEPMPHGLQDVGEMLSFINNHKLAQNRPMYQQPPAGSSHSSGSAPHRGLGVRGSVAAAAAIAANDPKWVQPSGPRRHGEGVENEEQGIVTASNSAGGVTLRITLLAAGFVIGPSGSSVREIMRVTGVDIKSWTEQASTRTRRPCRVFCAEGNEQQLLDSLAIVTAAVDRYKQLCEGSFHGKCVSRQQRVHGVDFCYQPPPRNIVPCAAALKGQPVGLRAPRPDTGSPPEPSNVAPLSYSSYQSRTSGGSPQQRYSPYTRINERPPVGQVSPYGAYSQPFLMAPSSPGGAPFDPFGYPVSAPARKVLAPPQNFEPHLSQRNPYSEEGAWSRFSPTSRIPNPHSEAEFFNHGSSTLQHASGSHISPKPWLLPQQQQDASHHYNIRQENHEPSIGHLPRPASTGFFGQASGLVDQSGFRPSSSRFSHGASEMGTQQQGHSHPVSLQGQYHGSGGGADVFDMHKAGTRPLQPQMPQQHHYQQPAQLQQQTYQHLSGKQQLHMQQQQQQQQGQNYFVPAGGPAGAQGVGPFGHVEHPGLMHDGGSAGTANLPYMPQHSSPIPQNFVPAGMGPNPAGHPGLHLDANGSAAYQNYLLKTGPAGYPLVPVPGQDLAPPHPGPLGFDLATFMAGYAAAQPPSAVPMGHLPQGPPQSTGYMNLGAGMNMFFPPLPGSPCVMNSPVALPPPMHMMPPSPLRQAVNGLYQQGHPLPTEKYPHTQQPKHVTHSPQVPQRQAAQPAHHQQQPPTLPVSQQLLANPHIMRRPHLSVTIPIPLSPSKLNPLAAPWAAPGMSAEALPIHAAHSRTHMSHLLSHTVQQEALPEPVTQEQKRQLEYNADMYNKAVQQVYEGQQLQQQQILQQQLVQQQKQQQQQMSRPANSSALEPSMAEALQGLTIACGHTVSEGANGGSGRSTPTANVARGHRRNLFSSEGDASDDDRKQDDRDCTDSVTNKTPRRNIKPVSEAVRFASAGRDQHNSEREKLAVAMKAQLRDRIPTPVGLDKPVVLATDPRQHTTTAMSMFSSASGGPGGLTIDVQPEQESQKQQPKQQPQTGQVSNNAVGKLTGGAPAGGAARVAIMALDGHISPVMVSSDDPLVSPSRFNGRKGRKTRQSTAGAISMAGTAAEASIQYDGAGHRGDQNSSGDGAAGTGPRSSQRKKDAEGGGPPGGNEIHTPTRSSFAGAGGVVAATNASGGSYGFDGRLNHDLAMLTGSSQAATASPDTPYPYETSPAGLAYTTLNASPSVPVHRVESSSSAPPHGGLASSQPYGLPPRGPTTTAAPSLAGVQAGRMYAVSTYEDDVLAGAAAARDGRLRRSHSMGLPQASPRENEGQA